MSQLPHDQEAFETEFVKVIPMLKGRESVYFAKNSDGEYTHPEAKIAYLGFKLGGNYACGYIATQLKGVR